MRAIMSLSLLVVLGGCASVSYILAEYDGVQLKTITMPEDEYRVFDKPIQNKMMVTPSLGATAAQGFGSGLLLGAVDNTPPRPRFEAAALAFLEQDGRRGCRVLDAYVLARPQYEVKYDCAPIAAGAAAPPVARSARNVR
jgi:hypothetical protein